MIAGLYILCSYLLDIAAAAGGVWFVCAAISHFLRWRCGIEVNPLETGLPALGVGFCILGAVVFQRLAEAPWATSFF